MSPMSLTNKVAVAGITGKLGRLIAKQLLSADYVEVHAIARNPDKLPDDIKSNSRVKIFQSDLTDSASLREAVKGCSILVSAVLSDPSTEAAMAKAMIDACIAEGVPRFMPNEFTLDWRSVDLELLPQKKGNQEILEYLDRNSDEITGVHVLIGGFMETLFSAGFWFDPSKNPAESLAAWGNGDEIWEMTSYNNTAEYTAAVALDKEATGFLKFLGDRVSLQEIANTLQEVYNLPPILVGSRGSMQNLKNKVELESKRNRDSPNFWDFKGLSYSLFLTNGQAYLETPLDNARYLETVQQETLEDWLRGRKLQELSKSAWF